MNDINWQEVDQMTMGGDLYAGDENEDAAPPREKAVVEITPNNEANLAELRESGMFAFNVWYRNTDLNKTVCVGARWKRKTSDFEYCDGRFFSPEQKPRLEFAPNESRRNPVLGWAKCSDLEIVEQ